LYPLVFDDADKDERRMGMEAGWAWIRWSDETWVFTDYGITEGMKAGIEKAQYMDNLVIYMNIGKNNGRV